MATKSILSNSAPYILTPMHGAHGVLQVKLIPLIEDHGLFMGESLLAVHNNGFSCHCLGERIIAAWEGKAPASKALEQFDYILRCGGLGKSRDSILWIAEGCKE